MYVKQKNQLVLLKQVTILRVAALLPKESLPPAATAADLETPCHGPCVPAKATLERRP